MFSGQNGLKRTIDCDDCNIIHEAGKDRNHFDINADGIENFKDFAEFADEWLWQASWY